MIENKKIIVIGSTNTDMVVYSDHFPKPGETVIGNKFLMNPGGKGANQAVAAVRMGGDVTFISRIGNDIFGNQALKLLQQESINISFMEFDKELSSGIALITVDQSGENCIVVAGGSNTTLSLDNPAIFQQAISTDSYLLMQLEIPLAAILKATRYAKDKQVTVILNPAPISQKLPEELLQSVDIITPNQEEAFALTGIEVQDEQSALLASQVISAMGPPVVIITMGHLGAFIYDHGATHFVTAYPVSPVDTTAAGDVFNGALVSLLSQGVPLIDAVDQASLAAAYSVTINGAQSSAPTRNELALFSKNYTK